ncbi:MAG: response regulator transcription factor [Pseudomonadota bacterium]
MKPLIFLLEDDADVARVIERTLQEQGFEADRFSRRAEFLRALDRQRPDLCLVDLELPDGDGLSLVGEALRRFGIPTIIVTGRGDLTDRLIGLEVGADDYIVKPFEPRELAARIRAVLRRGGEKTEAREAFSGRLARFEGWVADLDACSLTAPEGDEVPLSAAETALLRSFIERAGRVLSRAQLLDLTCEDDLDTFDRSMDVRVSRLRKKLRDDTGSARIIRTVYGAGYVFTPTIAWENS